MAVPLFIVDAFADRPFAGNPAAVCLLPVGHDEIADSFLQSVAAEMNLSETAFLVPRADGSWQLRWFTPTVEVDLCGHATLASAHVLWAEAGVSGDELVFHSRSGELRAKRREDLIELDFPRVRTITGESVAPETMAKILGVTPEQLVAYSQASAGPDWLIELDDAERVETLQPDFLALHGLPYRGLIVTARGGREGADFTSRFFAPAVGINEDPVTGSAHCALADYWCGRLDRLSMRGYQASARGGVVEVVVQSERVLLAGQANTVVAGQLRAVVPG